MNWRKKAMIGSAVWTALVFVVAVVMLARASRYATSPEHLAAWSGKVGEVTGSLLIWGNAAVWGVLWSRHKARQGGSRQQADATQNRNAPDSP
jgi:hypothetical protein